MYFPPLADNIRVLKDILTDQRTLIREYLQEEEEIPQLFAVYKEVEDYYFGDNQAEGLEHFEELEGVTLLLCEDNFGNMRALPKEEAARAALACIIIWITMAVRFPMSGWRQCLLQKSGSR